MRLRIEVPEQEILLTESLSRGFDVLFPPTGIAKGRAQGWGMLSVVGLAQDPIVLDLTMQCIVCPWLCQAPWRLVSAFLSKFRTPQNYFKSPTSFAGLRTTDACVYIYI